MRFESSVPFAHEVPVALREIERPAAVVQVLAPRDWASAQIEAWLDWSQLEAARAGQLGWPMEETELVDQLGLFHGPAELAGASSLELGPIQPGLDLGRRPVARRQHLDHGGRSLDLAQGHGDLVREGDAGFKAHDRLRKRRLREG